MSGDPWLKVGLLGSRAEVERTIFAIVSGLDLFALLTYDIIWVKLAAAGSGINQGIEDKVVCGKTSQPALRNFKGSPAQRTFEWLHRYWKYGKRIELAKMVRGVRRLLTFLGEFFEAGEA